MANGIRIYWVAAEAEDVYRYEIYRATSGGTPASYDYVLHASPGPNWTTKLSKFYYDDTDGETTYVYQVIGLTEGDVQVSDTGRFQPFPTAGASLQTRVLIDHDYGSADALKVVATGGAPVGDAEIRIYKATEYDAGRRTTWVSSSTTNALGQWAVPIYLEPGLDYVIVVEKPQAYQATVTRITV
jgi:hypothetical protein